MVKRNVLEYFNRTPNISFPKYSRIVSHSLGVCSRVRYNGSQAGMLANAERRMQPLKKCYFFTPNSILKIADVIQFQTLHLQETF